MVFAVAPGVFVQAHFAVVEEGVELPGIGQCIAQFEVGQPALIAGGFTLRVSAYAINTAEEEFLRAVEVAVRPLALQLAVQAEAVRQALQAYQARVELVEPALRSGGEIVGALSVCAIDSQAALAPGQGEAVDAAAEQGVAAVAGDAGGQHA